MPSFSSRTGSSPQVLPGFVVAPLFFQGKIELGVVSASSCVLGAVRMRLHRQDGAVRAAAAAAAALFPRRLGFARGLRRRDTLVGWGGGVRRGEGMRNGRPRASVSGLRGAELRGILGVLSRVLYTASVEGITCSAGPRRGEGSGVQALADMRASRCPAVVCREVCGAVCVVSRSHGASLCRGAIARRWCRSFHSVSSGRDLA